MTIKKAKNTRVLPRSVPKISENARMAAGWADRIESEAAKQKYTFRGLSIRAGLGSGTVRHLLRSADNISLGTLVKLADALGVSLVWVATGAHAFYESGNSASARVLMIPLTHADLIITSDARHVPVLANTVPQDSKALLITNTSMRIEGTNAPIDPAHVLLPGDIVVWSPSTRAEVGELVVASTPKGAVVRRLLQAESGDLQLAANNAAFPRLTIKNSDVLGGVSLVIRSALRA